jgi:hypothetical protein
MTATPSMTPNSTATVTGVLLACVGAAALIAVVQSVALSGAGSFRGTHVTAAPVTEPVQVRGSRAPTVLNDADLITVARARD